MGMGVIANSMENEVNENEYENENGNGNENYYRHSGQNNLNNNINNIPIGQYDKYKKEIRKNAIMPLNSLCNCGSKKKYKSCCLLKSE
jgi:hypothetical protein